MQSRVNAGRGLLPGNRETCLKGERGTFVHIAVYQPLVYFMTKNILF